MMVTTKSYWPRHNTGYNYNDGPFEMVPAWHPAKWLLGYDVRAWCNDIYYHIDNSRWVYGKSEEVARRLLQEHYDPDAHSAMTFD